MVDSKEIIPVENSPAYLTWRRYIITRLDFELAAEEGNLKSQEILIKRLKEEINGGIFSKNPDDLELKEIILKTCRLILEIRVYAASQACSTPFIRALYDLFKLTPYHHFAAKGDLKQFMEVYKTQPSLLKATDFLNYSPLYDAIMHNQTEIQKFYAEHLMLTPDTTVPILTKQSIVIGAGIEEIQGKVYVSLLHWGVAWADINFIQTIKQAGKINLFCMDNVGHWPIHYAMYKGILDMVPLLYDPDMRTIPNGQGHFLIHEINFFNKTTSIKFLEKLVSLGENINQLTKDGRSILSMVLIQTTYSNERSLLEGMNRRLELATTLLRMGANINQISSYGFSFDRKKSFVEELVLTWTEENIEYTIPLIAQCIEGGVPRITIQSDMEISEKLQKEIIEEATEFVIKEYTPRIIAPQSLSLLHLCLLWFPRNAETLQEKENIKYILNVMNFLIKNGINLDIREATGVSALELAEGYSYRGAAYMLKWWQKRKITEQLIESGVDKKFTPLVLQYYLEDTRLQEKYTLSCSKPTPKNITSGFVQ